MDKKQGYKKFKIGSAFSDYAQQIEPFSDSKTDGDNALYKYTGNEYNEFQEHKIELIVLRFYKEKLVRILMTLDKPNEYLTYDRLLKNLEDAFGKSLAYVGHSTVYDRYNSWEETEKIEMVLYKYRDDLILDDLEGKLGVSMSQKNIDKIITLDDF
ncbi:MAG: hypothetical protein KBF73_10225 [Flavobacteriales bacterium]|nr:hypothetical protein [Flavobacteriales bacterium]